MTTSIPFFANTADDTHCYQAALKIVLKHFIPEKDYSFEELDRMTAKVEHLWTWPTQGILHLHSLGFNIVGMDTFEIEKFVAHGGDYLIEKYGTEVGEAQIAHSIIPQEQTLYAQYLALNIHKTQMPTLDDVKKFIDAGYLIICNINSKALNDKSGYIGHFVVLFAYDTENFTLHDPGLPPLPARKVSYDQFTKAWAYPTEDSKNILALKK